MNNPAPPDHKIREAFDEFFEKTMPLNTVLDKLKFATNLLHERTRELAERDAEILRLREALEKIADYPKAYFDSDDWALVWKALDNETKEDAANKSCQRCHEQKTR